jgi:hypothetical protein
MARPNQAGKQMLYEEVALAWLKLQKNTYLPAAHQVVTGSF